MPARLSLAVGRLEIVVNDTGAAYPLTVDPTLTQAAELTTSNEVSNDLLGESVAVDGSTIVVGASGLQVGSHGSQGAVYVFEKPAGGWADATQTAELTASDGAAGDQLGGSVAVQGETVVAGAAGHGSDTGAVYVYTEPTNGWTDATQTAELTGSDGAQYDLFGKSVAVDGNTIAVGSDGHDVNGHSAQGAVYVYTEPGGGWADATQTAELTASDGAAQDGLGISVAIDGSTIVAGAPSHAVGGHTGQGAVYVFEKPAGGWTNGTQTAELTASDGAANDELGASVAIDGSTIAASAPHRTVSGHADQGAVYMFDEPTGGWVDGTQTAELTASDGAVLDSLGVSVAVYGDTVVAAADNHTVGGHAEQGAVYVFDEPAGGWVDGTQSDELVASDGAAYDFLGWSVASDGGVIVAGAPSHSAGSASYDGAAYVFDPPAPVNTSSPTITGTATQGGTLTVSGGSWSGNPTGYTYQWEDCDSSGQNCTPITGATGQSYQLTSSDAGHTIVVVETASNGGGPDSVVSAATPVVAPASSGSGGSGSGGSGSGGSGSGGSGSGGSGSGGSGSGGSGSSSAGSSGSNGASGAGSSSRACVRPTGSMHGIVLGPVQLGLSVAVAARAFASHDETYFGTERFCVTDGDERVEKPTQKLLTQLSPSVRHGVQDRVVLELTANPHYAVDGVSHGATVADAVRKLKLGRGIQIGLNTWYLATSNRDDVIVKARGGQVQEIGYVDRDLVSGPGRLVWFFSTFRHSDLG